ncbi:hypothetical protein K7432_005380 [Basidiobolus ranarum]|uniref:YCII-related domain-containing protein n=1 Tax=Basidiobolus ranarum TaxID=34480 RepID=A0ABR2WWK8_9FUNG
MSFAGLKQSIKHLGILAPKRGLSSCTPTSRQFLVIAKDFSDKEALSRRMASREEHLDNARELYSVDTILAGGAIFSEEGENGKMIGSCLVYEAENSEAVKKMIAKDPYIKGKVWDKIDIYPLKLALPFKA